mmetsp:Transcript_120134/g.347103  ORF Transcript_120134/g.347103 Transcript_120134/m.347103 type:complete len:146 (+) Transcript_120134:66-503(+)
MAGHRVEQAARFLLHERVRHEPAADRRAFLVSKGLTDQEILRAFRTAERMSAASAATGRDTDGSAVSSSSGSPAIDSVGAGAGAPGPWAAWNARRAQDLESQQPQPPPPQQLQPPPPQQHHEPEAGSNPRSKLEYLLGGRENRQA